MHVLILNIAKLVLIIIFSGVIFIIGEISIHQAFGIDMVVVYVVTVLACLFAFFFLNREAKEKDLVIKPDSRHSDFIIYDAQKAQDEIQSDPVPDHVAVEWTGKNR